MKTRSVFALALLLAAARLPAQQAAFHVSDYDLTIELPDTGKVIAGHAVLTVIRRARADTVVLDLLDLTVSKVTLGGAQAAFTQDAEHVRIFVGGVRSDTLRVAVDYAGAVKDGLIIGTDSAGRWMAFGDNWPNRARHWIPSIDHPSDKSTVSWTVRAPFDRTVVANGRNTHFEFRTGEPAADAPSAHRARRRRIGARRIRFPCIYSRSLPLRSRDSTFRTRHVVSRAMRGA